jgi:ribonucleoside-diphosphate reductase alpha chain
MNVTQEILSEITTYMKYSKFVPAKNRREIWQELITRNKEMHQAKFPKLHDEIEEAYKLVYDKKVLPSMRSLQFAGRPIELNNARIFNCSFLPLDDWRSFSEIMFLLLSGCGVGYSVQKHHIDQLPEIKVPTKHKRYLIGDSIEGWADAVRMLCKAYFTGVALPLFDFRDIRPKGAQLITVGGKAPGPEPLKECLFQLNKIFERKQNGEKITSVEAHDMACHIADAVLSGGIRRAALISLFNLDDEDMLTCKFGNWWEENPQRGRANNSAVVLRHKIDKEEFFKLWKKIELSGSGEPGIYLSNDKDWGTNPSLRAGTKVFTTEGIFNIEELQDKTFKVKNLNGNISDAKCWLSGKEKQLYEITLEGGHKYWSTPEHEWPIWNGKEWVKYSTDKITKGMKLPILKQDLLFSGSLGTYVDGFVLGWCLGDGNMSLSNVGKKQLGFVFSKEDQELGISNKIIEFLNRIGDTDIKGHQHKHGTLEIQTTNFKIISYFEHYGFKHKSEGLPIKLWKEGSEDFIKGIISGLISSDGSISEIKSKRITFNSSYEKLIRDVSELLGFYGIKTSIYEKITEGDFPNKKYNGKLYKGFSLVINENSSLRHFHKLFRLEHAIKQQKLNNLVDALKKKNNKNEDKLEIIDIKLSDVKEDVWDISVFDETHCFQISHVITGNCCEIALRPYQFCNLCEVNVSNIESQEDLNERVRVGAFIGTLQAAYTDFHYLRDIWRKTTEKDALLGVGMTGIGSGVVLKYDLKKAADLAKEENARVAEIIGINKAARVTTVKPSGTSSLVLGTSSGIHAWHNDYYIRRIRVGKNEAIYSYLAINHPELIEDDFFKPTIQAVISVPQKAPEGSILRTENVIDMLERTKRFNLEWVRKGHRKGANTNNVSATVSIQENEWEAVGNWMWENKDTFNGLSVLPYFGGTYKQSPYEDCTKEQFEEMAKHLHQIDLSKIIEFDDNTALMDQQACAGNQCEIV